jgi:sulfur relay (sulfurtransferase) DsrC/TusE family protein
MYTPFVFQEYTEEELTTVCDFGECKNCDAIDECICNGKIDTEEVEEEVKEEVEEEVSKEEVKEEVVKEEVSKQENKEEVSKESFTIIQHLLSFFTKYLGCSNTQTDVIDISNKPAEVEKSEVLEPVVEKNVI